MCCGSQGEERGSREAVRRGRGTNQEMGLEMRNGAGSVHSLGKEGGEAEEKL